MNKLLILVFCLLSFAGYSQTISEPYRLFPKANFSPPSDTAINPVKVGEIRYRIADSKFYKSISLTGKKWDEMIQFAGSGIVTLNTLTNSTQTFATGTTGSDFGISSTGSTHTFNLPDAGASARGLVSTGTQSFAGAKTFNSPSTFVDEMNLSGTNSYFRHAQTSSSILLGMENGTAYLMYNAGTRNIEFGANTVGRIRYRNTGNHIFGELTDDGSSKVQVDGNIKVGGLAGSGTRGVVVDNNGILQVGTAYLSQGIRVVDDADFTVSGTDYTVLIKNNTTTRTGTMPAASSNTNRVLRIVNTGTSAVTSSVALRISPSTTTTSIGVNTTVEVHSDGTDWWIIGIYAR